MYPESGNYLKKYRFSSFNIQEYQFIENNVVDEDCATDIEVVNNYSFESIMNILAKVTS